jgi:peptide/nickel transport system ATP-binding protein
MNADSYSVSIRSQNRRIVAIDKFDVCQNEITLLFGESGIGKSMISKAVYGLLDRNELEVTVNGRPYAAYLDDPAVQEIKKNSFFVFQEPSSHLNPLLRISDQLGEGSLRQSDGEREILGRLWGGSDPGAAEKIVEVFPKPYRPSGGEKQRVLLAMAFKKIDVLLKRGPRREKTFFVFDEPTGSLDNTYRNLFLEMLFELYGRMPFTVMLITHDYSVISELYAKYPQLLDRIHLKELRRVEEAHVEVVDFSAQEYLGWLKQTRHVEKARPAGAVVCDMEPRFSVFNRTLCIYKDEGHSRPSNLVIRSGEMVYLKAQSGVGKTTLAKLIMGLYSPQKFSMTLCGMGMSERTRKNVWQEQVWGTKAGMVFQHADEALDLKATVKETFDGLPAGSKMDASRLRTFLQELFEGPIPEAFLNKKVGMLSGGQKQRLNLLRTLALGNDLIILDEPLNGLDFQSVKKVLGLLQQRRAQGCAMLMISHNEEIFENIVDAGHTYYLAQEDKS